MDDLQGAELHQALLHELVPLAMYANGVKDYLNTSQDGEVADSILLDLYPYSSEAVVSKMIEAIEGYLPRWPRFGIDTRQQKLDNLSSAARIPNATMLKAYGFRMLSADDSIEPLQRVCYAEKLQLDKPDAARIERVLNGLQLVAAGTEPNAAGAGSMVALAKFFRAFVQACQQFQRI